MNTLGDSDVYYTFVDAQTHLGPIYVCKSVIYKHILGRLCVQMCITYIHLGIYMYATV